MREPVGGSPVGGNPVGSPPPFNPLLQFPHCFYVGGQAKKANGPAQPAKKAEKHKVEEKSTPAPVQTPANRKRNLEKRLRQIEELKAKQKDGAELNEDQRNKIATEEAIRAEIITLSDSS